MSLFTIKCQKYDIKLWKLYAQATRQGQLGGESLHDGYI